VDVPVAVGVILKNKQVLIAQRPAKVYLGGFWEFPGGKLEVGEDAYTALCRELKEELAITLSAAKFLMSFRQQYDDKAFILEIWLVTEYQGEPSGAEGQNVMWANIDELATIAMLEGNKPIVNYLQNTFSI